MELKMTRLLTYRTFILLFLFGFLQFETRASADTSAEVPPGKLVDVGGRKLHLYCTGQGSPTVILEAGAGSFAIDWALVQPEVARTTRVCSYDRAGYGWSDPGPEADTVGQVTHDLETAMRTSGEHPPYVLVGQSIGGLFVRWYQHEHPQQVVGMVLVENYEMAAPVNGKQVPLYTLTKEQLQANLPPPSSLKKPPIPTEVRPPFNKLPPPLQKTHLWLEQRFFETLDFNKGPAMMESWRTAFTVLHQAPLTPDSLAGVPLIILTRDNLSEDERKQQMDLLHLSRNARQETATGSGHFIHIERPDLVVASINEVLAPRSTQESVDGVKDGGASLQKFVGTWEGKCQDGATFVVVDLQPNGAQLRGTVSIGNMQGDNTGACLMVLAPPSPEHSQKISSTSAEHNVLSFNGAKRPDGTFARFEIKETGEGKGELKLLDTPVADHPWQLVRVRKPKDH
jgi:pimeloyl-ACP methyl ester carboxylesterase